MKTAGKYLLLSVLLLCSRFVAWSQAATPQAALEELVAAEKIEDAARHYPVAMQQALKDLPKNERAEASRQVLIREKLKQAGHDLRGPAGDTWQIVDGNKEIAATVKLVNSFVSGDEAILEFKIFDPEERPDLKLVRLRFQDGEWRIMNVGDLLKQADFESEEFIRGLTSSGRNESAAVSNLTVLNGVLGGYAMSRGDGTSRSEAEFPVSLKELFARNDQNTEQDADPLDSSFAQEPVVKDGYKFTYTLIGTGQYRISATPVDFGNTGNRSFSTDQTGEIRFTVENREATENDAKLSPASFVHSSVTESELSFEKHIVVSLDRLK